jgi:hypothetical protein
MRCNWVAFLGINALLLLLFFWPAVTGRALLAPLNIAPTLFAKYEFVDPNADVASANHYTIDLMLGDLSRNWLVHQAWRRGEMPWWDPFTDGGRPLAAEAHAVNASDPVKFIAFALLPFEAAYNWARILPFLVSGLAAFLLLRSFGFPFAPACWGGLLYEFAGCNFLLFSGPTIQASFAWYPLLWWFWHRGVQQRKLFWFILSGLATTLIFLSGNLQSHSYLFLFAVAFALGYGWKEAARWRLLVAGTAIALVLGLCLASPFVLPQVEMFLLSTRGVQPLPAAAYLSGVGSIFAVFPWALGTFRTLDLSKLVAQSGLGFWLHIGSAAMCMAALAAWRSDGPSLMVKRTALALGAVFLMICSTPLLRFFYVRMAWLAVLGAVVLFAMGWQYLAALKQPEKRWGSVICGIALLFAVVCNLGGLVLYPRFQARVEEKFLRAQQANVSLDAAESLRRFQVRNFSNEVTFRNPETVLAFLSLMSLGGFLLRPPQAKHRALHIILLLSTAPLLFFGHRYIPMQPMAYWERLKQGGPEQRRVQSIVGPHQRLLETAPGHHDYVFPGALAQLHGLHVLHGHFSLSVKSPGSVRNASGEVPATLYDFEYRSGKRGLESGELSPSPGSGWSRFQWKDGVTRGLHVRRETLTTLQLAVEPGPAGTLVRTDTSYPGWRAFADRT